MDTINIKTEEYLPNGAVVEHHSSGWTIWRRNGVVHREDGPAVTGPHGIEEYWLFGVMRTEAMVMGLDPWAILSTVNIEARRICIAAYGHAKFCADVGAKTIDIDVNRETARCLVRLPGDGGQYLVATDGSTGRVYWMPVSGDAKTCGKAHESISGLPDDKYGDGS